MSELGNFAKRNKIILMLKRHVSSWAEWPRPSGTAPPGGRVVTLTGDGIFPACK